MHPDIFTTNCLLLHFLFTETTITTTGTAPVDTTVSEEVPETTTNIRDEQISSSTMTINTSGTVESSAGSDSPALPTTIPKTSNDIAVDKTPATEAGKGKEEDEESVTENQEKESRSMDSELPSAGLRPQGRAITNFVTVAPATGGEMPPKAMPFDLSDVSMDVTTEEEKGAESAAMEKKPTDEVTCAFEGKTFKVRGSTGILFILFDYQLLFRNVVLLCVSGDL